MRTTSENQRSDELSVFEPDRIDGVVPGVRGHRAFPTRHGLRDADPFLLLDHIGPQRIDPNRVIDGKPHPHRGFETVSIILDGELDHIDSRGNRFRLRAGDVLIMNAGSGIIHGGDMRPDRRTGAFHEFQLWVNVPSEHKMTPPSVQHLRASTIPVLSDAGASVRVLSGTYRSVTAAANTAAAAVVLHAKLKPGSAWSTDGIGPSHRVLVYVISGSATIAGTLANAHQTLDLGAGNHPAIPAGAEGAELLVLAGRPLREPVVFGGPFVMNSQAEIERAFADYEAGRFGSIGNEEA